MGSFVGNDLLFNLHVVLLLASHVVSRFNVGKRHEKRLWCHEDTYVLTSGMSLLERWWMKAKKTKRRELLETLQRFFNWMWWDVVQLRLWLVPGQLSIARLLPESLFHCPLTPRSFCFAGFSCQVVVSGQTQTSESICQDWKNLRQQGRSAGQLCVSFPTAVIRRSLHAARGHGNGNYLDYLVLQTEFQGCRWQLHCKPLTILLNMR